MNNEGTNHKVLQSQAIRGLFSFVFHHPKSLFAGLSMVVIGTTCALLEPRLLGYLIDDAILPKDWGRFRFLFGTFVIVTVLRVIAAARQGYFFELLGQSVTQDLRLKLFSHIQQMPVAVFDKTPAGRLLTRVTNDIAGLNEMFSAGFVAMLCNVLMVIGILIGLMTLDFKLGLISSSVFPFLVLISVFFSRRLKVTYREARNKLSALNAFLAENFSGMRIVHLFNRQRLHFEKFEKLNDEYAEAQTGSIRVFALFQPAITVAVGVSVGLVIWYGGKEALSGQLKVGVLVTFFSYVLSLFQPVREIADKWNIFLSGMASAERIFSVLSEPNEFGTEAVNVPAQSLSHLKGDIVFENVWFAYEKENWIFKDFSLAIKAGEKIGVVGHTGAGKSTLIHLFLRFYEPQRGRILIDGKDIREYDKRTLRASIGIVQQDCFLFSGTFEENVTFWRNLPTQHIHQILSKLGLNALQERSLQERGSNFSMGERQVIAFARAMVNDPKIWILDEATANMDSETEGVLQCALESLGKNNTSIYIAHRLATVRSADRIIVLRKGTIQESGSHEELMRQKGLYARLYSYQVSTSEH